MIQPLWRTCKRHHMDKRCRRPCAGTHGWRQTPGFNRGATLRLRINALCLLVQVACGVEVQQLRTVVQPPAEGEHLTATPSSTTTPPCPRFSFVLRIESRSTSCGPRLWAQSCGCSCAQFNPLRVLPVLFVTAVQWLSYLFLLLPGLASPLLRGRAAPGVPSSRALGAPCFPLFPSCSTPNWFSRAEVKESYCLWTVWLKPLIGEVNQAF